MSRAVSPEPEMSSRRSRSWRPRSASAHGPLLPAEQARAYSAVSQALDEARRSPGRTAEPALFLLRGVTGSGKTEVYLAAAERVREHGGVPLVLVPEIALAPQTVARFRARMPGRVTVLHSALSPGELEDHRRRRRAGEVDVVIGSRSALFAPVEPALIVIDEEHEWTYKQTDPAPRYHVREVVERYCELTGAVAVFGSATPDLVTHARAQLGRYRQLDLAQRVRKPGPGESVPPTIPLPAVELVDLREELVAGNRSLFSRALRSALSITTNSEQPVTFEKGPDAAQRPPAGVTTIEVSSLSCVTITRPVVSTEVLTGRASGGRPAIVIVPVWL